ncbi:MAG: hypothetical protein HeimC3_31960 [Candidatus Heimdallarchaeota archaeon LC_3]|nr:MAG: hypothetical protein HeimC3_31960 [Candidatus Heimdallarchaeota archaeon LC_3]
MYQLEFKAEISDERTYTYKKLYSKEVEDHNIFVYDKNGEYFNIPIINGSIVTVRVSEYFRGEVFGSYVVDGIFKIFNVTILQFVLETTENKSYWENNFYPGGYYLVRREISFYDEFVFIEIENFNKFFNLTSITKKTIDYKNGWLEYSYLKQTNETTGELLFERELESKKHAEKSLGIEMQKLFNNIITNPLNIIIITIFSILSLRIILRIKKKRNQH